MKRIGRGLLLVVAVCLAGYIVWDRVEAHRFAQDIAAIAARGEPASYEAAFPGPSTPQQQEAAKLYLEAAEAAREQAAEDNNLASRIDVDKPGGAEIPFDSVRTRYSGTAAAMQLLDRATPLDFHGFPTDDRQRGYYEYNMGYLGSLACLRADVAAVIGDGETAVAALVPCVRLIQVFVSAISRTGHANRIVGSVRILFRHTTPSASALESLQRAFDVWPDGDPTIRNLQLDRARLIDMSSTPLFPGIGPTVGLYVFHPFVLRSARGALAAYEPAMARASASWAVRWQRTDELLRRVSQRQLQAYPAWKVRLLDPFSAFGPFDTFSVRSSAAEVVARGVTVATIAAERYRRAHGGTPPASLDALVPEFLRGVPEDPYSGKPLIYNIETDGYTIYSVDTNRKDDGGILYGFGAAQEKHVGPQSPRDFGIHVPLRLNAQDSRLRER